MNIMTEINKTLAGEFARYIADNPRIEKKLSLLLEQFSRSFSVIEVPVLPEISSTELDAKITRLTLRYENDSSVLIEGDDFGSVILDCKQLGFRDQRTKGWKFLTEILQNPKPSFNFGTAYWYPDGLRANRIKNKDYDARWKLCDEVCKKLTRTLEARLGYSFPKNYKLYQRVATGPEGERRFKFHIGAPLTELCCSPQMKRLEQTAQSEFLQMKESDMVDQIHNLYDDYLLRPDDLSETPERLAIAFKVGQQRFGWSDGRMEAILNR